MNHLKSSVEETKNQNVLEAVDAVFKTPSIREQRKH